MLRCDNICKLRNRFDIFTTVPPERANLYFLPKIIIPKHKGGFGRHMFRSIKQANLKIPPCYFLADISITKSIAPIWCLLLSHLPETYYLKSVEIY